MSPIGTPLINNGLGINMGFATNRTSQQQPLTSPITKNGAAIANGGGLSHRPTINCLKSDF